MRLRSRNILTPPPLEAPALEEAEVVSREPSVLEALPVMVSEVPAREGDSVAPARRALTLKETPERLRNRSCELEEGIDPEQREKMMNL
ncbi:hypothetical protein V1505DRAFT_358619 [Lipomyces doorenjongii]